MSIVSHRGWLQASRQRMEGSSGMPSVATKKATGLDLRFQSFGQWCVLGKGKKTAHGQFWICQCQGGCQPSTQAQIHEAALVEGRAQSCGCDRKPRRILNFTGLQFTNWLVLSYIANDKRKATYFLCQCLCGTKKEVASNSLKTGDSNGCKACQNNNIKRIKKNNWYGNLFTMKDLGNGLWHCRCICGVEKKKVRAEHLASGRTKSCGCRQSIPVLGRIFGRLSVLSLGGALKYGHRAVRYQCSCGNIVEVGRASMIAGDTKSCGCLMREQSANTLQKYNKSRRQWTQNNTAFWQQFATPALATLEGA